MKGALAVSLVLCLHAIGVVSDPYDKKADAYPDKIVDPNDPYGKHDEYAEKKVDPGQDAYGEVDPYHKEMQEKQGTIDAYAEERAMKKTQEEEFMGPFEHEKFQVHGNQDLVVRVTNSFGHTCAFHFTTADFEGEEEWDLLLFDQETHHECTAVRDAGIDDAHPLISVFTSAALVVKDEYDTEFGIAGVGAGPADAETEFFQEKTDIGHGLTSNHKTFQGKLSKLAIHFVPKKDEF
eukprot:m.171966 g.171966  ORF g.171966 m.171966 type:complete len:236 (-) comp13452_c0_seq1:32-739(-)